MTLYVPGTHMYIPVILWIMIVLSISMYGCTRWKTWWHWWVCTMKNMVTLTWTGFSYRRLIWIMIVLWISIIMDVHEWVQYLYVLSFEGNISITQFTTPVNYRRTSYQYQSSPFSGHCPLVAVVTDFHTFRSDFGNVYRYQNRLISEFSIVCKSVTTTTKGRRPIAVECQFSRECARVLGRAVRRTRTTWPV